jgi:hypothetical protein
MPHNNGQYISDALHLDSLRKTFGSVVKGAENVARGATSEAGRIVGGMFKSKPAQPQARSSTPQQTPSSYGTKAGQGVSQHLQDIKDIDNFTMGKY